ncbi:MAG: uroporphyrinogen-III C-methyltransferase [Pseudomonadota bacterium]|nr:uroporphyrinogen-III C-methyltransferase [Pseudomonadota bacterium]
MPSEPTAPLPPALPSPEPSAQAAAAPPASAFAPPPSLSAPLRRARARGLQPGLVLAWAVAAVALTVSVLLWQRVNGMQAHLARQSAEAGNQSVEARTLARQADEAVRDSAAKLAALEARVADMTAYRVQLEDMVQTVTRARDENLPVELEAALRVAQDQTQLTGSVEPLLAALRMAEQRLGRAHDPRLRPVARAVGRDLERAKVAAIPDTVGLLGRIDQLLRQVDDLPLAGDVGRTRASLPPRETPPPAAESWVGRQWRAFWREMRGLVRVSRVERPEASMLAPEQAFFVREHLKLRLQGARLGLLARQYEAARADLAGASALIGTWFDPASARTQAAATLLQQIQGLTKSADMPRATESLRALGTVVATSGAAPGRD